MLRGVGVADSGLLVDAEHEGQVQGIGSMGECFLELSVHAQPVEGGVLAAEGVVEPVAADRPRGQGGAYVNEQMRIGGGGRGGVCAKP